MIVPAAIREPVSTARRQRHDPQVSDRYVPVEQLPGVAIRGVDH